MEQRPDILIERFDLRQVPDPGNLHEFAVRNRAGSLPADTRIIPVPLAPRGRAGISAATSQIREQRFPL